MKISGCYDEEKEDIKYTGDQVGRKQGKEQWRCCVGMVLRREI